MDEKRPEDRPIKKKKAKPAARKVIGNVRPTGDIQRKLPDRPTYEHG